MQCEGEAVLRAEHLDERAAAAIFLIGNTARNRSLLTEDRRNRPLHRRQRFDAKEKIDVLVRAGGILLRSFTGHSGRLNLLSKSYVGLRQFLNVAG